MPYHPALEAILDTPEIRQIKKMPLPQQREIFKNVVLEQFKQLPKSDVLIKNIKLDNNSTLRQYTPKNKSDKTILFIHGGGWSLGSIDTYDNVCRYLCDNGGFNIFSLDYALAPEYKFPAGVNHALEAYDWLINNSVELQIDRNNIFLMGDSAGANFATVISHERANNSPKAQILIYPAVDMFNKYDSHIKYDEPKYHLTMEWCQLFLNNYVNSPRELKNPWISPLLYDDIKQPDTFIVAATHDILIDSIYAFEQKLKEQNINVESFYDDEMFHGFISTINVSPLPNAKIALDKIITYINNK